MIKLLLFSTLITLGACAKARSTSIATDEIHAVFELLVTAEGTVECEASLRVGNGTGTQIEVVGEDEIVCSDGTKEVELEKNGSASVGTLHYATTELAYDAAKTYTITFKRGTVEAHTSTYSIPTPVVIATPAANASFTKGSAITATWNDGDADRVQCEIYGTGFNVSDTAGADDGACTVTDSHTTDAGGTLDATFRVKRSYDVDHPSSLKGDSYLNDYDEVAIRLVD